MASYVYIDHFERAFGSIFFPVLLAGVRIKASLYERRFRGSPRITLTAVKEVCQRLRAFSWNSPVNTKLFQPSVQIVSSLLFRTHPQSSFPEIFKLLERLLFPHLSNLTRPLSPLSLSPCLSVSQNFTAEAKLLTSTNLRQRICNCLS